MDELAPKKSPAVLVVEDEELMRMLATELAEEAGFESLQASSADEALRLLEQHPHIGIVFTDVTMPGSMNGLEFAHVAQRRWPSLRFVIVSGAYSPRPWQMPQGARFFAKPYDVNAVAAALGSP